MDAWVERELDGCAFPGGRLLGRCAKVLSALSQRIRHSVPGACQDWAATKAAYRFFANPRVDESMILAGHFAATRARFSDSSGRVLVFHDTTEFSFKRQHPESIGFTHETTVGQRKSDPTPFVDCSCIPVSW